jgi:4-amino-4-deoxy-L-arabinose transferase-like glycosyltransferase
MSARHTQSRRSSDLYLFAAIWILGIVLRFYDLAQLPPGLWFDEALNGLNALSLIEEQPLRLGFIYEGLPQEPLFMYLIAGLFLVFGASGLVIRLTSAVIGSLTIPLLYYVVRENAGRRVALLSALCFALLRWHVHFSRIGFRTILVPLVALACFLFFLRGVRTKKWSHFALAGLFLGLGCYTYLSFYFVPLILLLTLGVAHWTRSYSFSWKMVVLMFAVGLVVFLPLGITYMGEPEFLVGRVGMVSLFDQGLWSGVKQIVGNAKDVLLMFSFKGDHVPKHNIPYVPVLDIVTSLFFLIGMVTLIRGLKQSIFYCLAFWWFLLMMLPSVLSFGAPNLLRALGLTPALAIILALGYEKGYELARTGWGSRGLATVVILLCLGVFATVEVTRYFVVWRNDIRTWKDFNSGWVELARSVARVPEDTYSIYVPGDIFYHTTFKFIVRGRSDVFPMSLPDAFMRDEEHTRDHLVVTTLYGEVYPVLKRLFPQAPVVQSFSEPPAGAGWTWAYMFRIPLDDLLSTARAETLLKGVQVDVNR